MRDGEPRWGWGVGQEDPRIDSYTQASYDAPWRSPKVVGARRKNGIAAVERDEDGGCDGGAGRDPLRPGSRITNLLPLLIRRCVIGLRSYV